MFKKYHLHSGHKHKHSLVYKFSVSMTDWEINHPPFLIVTALVSRLLAVHFK